MWGPSNSLSEENVARDQQGLTPRVFELLFARLNEVSIRLLNYVLEIVCGVPNDVHCSFLFMNRSKLSILTSSSCISASALFLRFIDTELFLSMFLATFPFLVPMTLIFLLLQIYNEQITDLLDPNQRNLQVNLKHLSTIVYYFLFSCFSSL